MDRLIEDFIRDQQAASIGQRRIDKYWQVLRITQEKYYKKDYSSLDTDGLKEIVRQIEADSTHKDWTRHDYKAVMRKFARWLNSRHGREIDTSFISIKVKDSHKLPEELLTPEEVEMLVDACRNTRDKAILSVLYESGCRIGELLSLKVRSVQFDQYGAVLIIPTGKTGSRRVRIINSAGLLRNYIDCHPVKDGSCPLWVTNFNRKAGNNKWVVINSSSIRRILRIIAGKTGIKKRLYPHLFRHSRATHLANVLTESQLKEYFGWTQASDMAAVYVHLNGRDIDDAILKAHGLKKEDAKPEDMVIKFQEMAVSYPSLEKARFEGLMIDFLKTIGEMFPEVKEKFREKVKERGMEDMFGGE